MTLAQPISRFHPGATNPTMTLEEQYQAAYRRAMRAMKAIDAAIHDMPAPESESLTWSTLADMQRIMTDLEQITRYTR